MLSVSPLASVSFVSGEILTAMSSSVVALSLAATGGTFTFNTETLTVAVSVPPLPSLMV